MLRYVFLVHVDQDQQHKHETRTTTTTTNNKNVDDGDGNPSTLAEMCIKLICRFIHCPAKVHIIHMRRGLLRFLLWQQFRQQFRRNNWVGWRDRDSLCNWQDSMIQSVNDIKIFTTETRIKSCINGYIGYRKLHISHHALCRYKHGVLL